MSILTLGRKKNERKKKGKEGKFPIKEWEKAKKKRRKVPNQRVGESKKRKEGKFPNQRVGESKKEKKENSQIKEWEKAKKKRRKIPKSKSGRKKRKERKFPIKDRRKTEEMCRKVVGPSDI